MITMNNACSGRLTSGAGVPVVKPWFPLILADFFWWLPSFVRLSVSRPNGACNQIVHSCMYICCTCACHFVAPTLQLLTATGVRWTCHLHSGCLHSCLRWCSNTLCNFDVCFPSSLFRRWRGMLHCAPLRERERDGMHCALNNPGVQTELRAGTSTRAGMHRAYPFSVWVVRFR